MHSDLRLEISIRNIDLGYQTQYIHTNLPYINKSISSKVFFDPIHLVIPYCNKPIVCIYGITKC